MTERESSHNPSHETDDVVTGKRILMLHNDDEHTFDYVIQALMEICGHEFSQASQCATITHYKGKCDIKTGHLASLKLMKDALAERNLNVTID